jgi:predicted MPP superfamily phosphohydrolase
MRSFFIRLYATTALLHVPFALAVSHVAALLGAPWPWLCGAAVALLLVAGFRGRVELQRWDRHIGRARRLAEEAYFVHWMALLFALPLWLPVLGVQALVWSAIDIGRVAALSELGALCFALWGVVVARRRVRIDRVEVRIAGLDPALDGYRIAQLSDLHVGSLCPRARAERWVARTNALDADLVALTGDYVTTGVRFHQEVADALRELRARDGVFAVMGNHDYFGDGEPLMTRLRENGIRLLRNEQVMLTRNGARLCLAGVDDVYTRRADPARTLEGRDPDVVAIVMAHDPKLFPDLADRGAALVLSGHTHWGQLALPIFGARFNLANRFMRFGGGTHHRGDSVLHISPGLGTTGIPFRLGVPPSITLITLKTES